MIVFSLIFSKYSFLPFVGDLRLHFLEHLFHVLLLKNSLEFLDVERLDRATLADRFKGLNDKLREGDSGQLFSIDFEQKLSIELSRSIELPCRAARLLFSDGGGERDQPVDDELPDHLRLLHLVELHQGLEYLLQFIVGLRARDLLQHHLPVVEIDPRLELPPVDAAQWDPEVDRISDHIHQPQKVLLLVVNFLPPLRQLSRTDLLRDVLAQLEKGAHVQVAPQKTHLAAVQKLVYQPHVPECLPAVHLPSLPNCLSGKSGDDLRLVFLGFGIVFEPLSQNVGLSEGEAEVVKEQCVDGDEKIACCLDQVETSPLRMRREREGNGTKNDSRRHARENCSSAVHANRKILRVFSRCCAIDLRGDGWFDDIFGDFAASEQQHAIIINYVNKPWG